MARVKLLKSALQSILTEGIVLTFLYKSLFEGVTIEPSCQNILTEQK